MGIVGIALPSTIIGKSFIDIYFRVLDERKEAQLMMTKEREIMSAARLQAARANPWCCCVRPNGGRGGGGGGGSSRGVWRDIIYNRANSTTQIVSLRERQLEAERIEEAALVQEIEEQLNAQQQVHEEIVRDSSGVSSRAPSPMLLGTSHSGMKATSSAVALDKLPLARKIRKQQREIQQLGKTVRDQIAQIGKLTEMLGEMQNASLALMQKLDELDGIDD